MSVGTDSETVQTDRENVKSVRIHAKGATIKETDDDNTKITVPVSGLAEDRDGDKFSEDGVDSLVNQINNDPIPMFPNHGLVHETGMYEYPFEDIMGKWVEAERDGELVQASAILRDGNEYAEELKDLLDQEMPVAFSVGFGWNESDAEERDSGGTEFHDSDLMEISTVGIGSYPDAVVQSGAKLASAMQKAGLNPSKDMDSVDIQINTMSDTENTESEDTETEETERNSEETETEDSTEKEEQKQATVEVSAVMDAINAHMMALEEDLAEMADGETEELDEMDDEEEEEETESEDGDDEEEDKVASLKEELETLKAELETVKTETAETSERKGGMEPAEKEESEETKDRQTPEEFAKNIV